MRPKKKICLLARSKKTKSELRFVLWTKGYEVFSTTLKTEAIIEIKEKVYDALLVESPWKFDVPSLGLHYRLPHISFGNQDQPVEFEADHVVIAGKDFNLRLMDTLKLALKRKRGPKKGYIPERVIAKGVV